VTLTSLSDSRATAECRVSSSSTMRSLTAAVFILLLATTSAAWADDAAERAWELWAGVDAIFSPEGDRLAPTVMFDRDALHLEVRYAYEGERTTSLWAGRNFRAADGASWVVTPMLGVALGDVRGVLPGAEVIASWKALDLYVEAEHLFSASDGADDFSYVWSELALSPRSWLRTGIVFEGTWSGGAFERNPGYLVGVTLRNATLTASGFSLGKADEKIVLSFGVEF
jgi:hypothetical protein